MSATRRLARRVLVAAVCLLALVQADPSRAETVVRALPPAQSTRLESIGQVAEIGGLAAEPDTRVQVRPRLRRDPERLARLKSSPEAPAAGGASVLAERAGSRSALLVLGFDGLSNADNAIANASVLPPDPNLAVGPDHVVQMVNIVGRVMNKSGGILSTFSLHDFFGIGTGDETDPHIHYDVASGRWFAVMAEISTSSSSLVLAVSQSSDPTRSFCRYRLGNPSSETFVQDFPLLGMNADKIVVSYNGFTFDTPQRSLGAGYYVVSKADLVACAASPHVVRVPPERSRFTPYPAPALTGTGTLYMAMNDSPSLSIIAVDGVPGLGPLTESISALPIRSWGPPPNADQAGTAILLDTGDESVLDAVWQGGSLWVAGNEACSPAGDRTPRSCLRVIEARTDTRSIRQDITFGDAGEHYFYPAVRPDDAGDLHVVFSASSTSKFAEVRATGRLASDPLGTLQPSFLLRAGGGAQTHAAPSRFGDYSGAAVDPSDPGSVWVTGEYVRSTASVNWGTYIARLRFDIPRLLAAVLPSSRSVVVGRTATAFATVINAGTATASGVSISLASPVAAELTYQTTDPLTNQVTGSSETPVDIPPGQSQSFVIGVTAPAPVDPQDLAFSFEGDNSGPAPTGPVNTLLFSASPSPVPDVVALAATLGNDGIVRVPAPGAIGVFAVSTSNVGAGGSVTVAADTGAVSLPVEVTLCRTDPATGQCLAAPAPTVAAQLAAGQSASFGVFVHGSGPVALDPAINRVFVRFRDAGLVVRGATSVAVTAP